LILVQVIKEIAKTANELGRELATSNEARKLLGIKKKFQQGCLK